MFKTQAAINHYIDQCIERAERAEIRRDREPFESPTYWAFHDTAMRWYKRVDDLGPGGSFWKRQAEKRIKADVEHSRVLAEETALLLA